MSQGKNTSDEFAEYALQLATARGVEVPWEEIDKRLCELTSVLEYQKHHIVRGLDQLLCMGESELWSTVMYAVNNVPVEPHK